MKLYHKLLILLALLLWLGYQFAYKPVMRAVDQDIQWDREGRGR